MDFLMKTGKCMISSLNLTAPVIHQIPTNDRTSCSVIGYGEVAEVAHVTQRNSMPPPVRMNLLAIPSGWKLGLPASLGVVLVM